MIAVAFFFFPVSIKADCEICDFTIDEIFFNESIVGYYMAGFDLSTGDSNVLLFEYLINGPAECYYSSSGDEKLEIRFKLISKPKTKFFIAKAKVKGNPIYPNPNMPIEYIQIMKITYII